MPPRLMRANSRPSALATDWRSIGLAACGAAGLALATWVLRGTAAETLPKH